MLVTSLCWWLYDGDWFQTLAAESLCWRLFSLCWRFSQCKKLVTNISNFHQYIWSPTSVTNIDATKMIAWSENFDYVLQWTPGVKWRFWSLIHKDHLVPNERCLWTSLDPKAPFNGHFDPRTRYSYLIKLMSLIWIGRFVAIRGRWKYSY